MDAPAATREILEELKRRVAAGHDGGLYGDRAQAARELDVLLASSSNEEIRLLLAPTANLHELAMENGWGKEFNGLAERLERILGIR